jgi:hypothetical protein
LPGLTAARTLRGLKPILASLIGFSKGQDKNFSTGKNLNYIIFIIKIII